MKTALSLSLILFAALCCFAQGKEISETEFMQAMTKGRMFYNGKAYRMIETAETVVKGKPERSGTSKSVTEFTAAQPRMMHSKTNYLFYPNERRKEMILIGKVLYSRDDDKAWETRDFAKMEADALSIPNPLLTLEEQKIHKIFQIEIQDNQQITVLGFARTTKHRDSRSNREFTISGTYKNWIAPDGRLLKTESNTIQTSPDGEIKTSIMTTVYEFDPNITVEAPL